MTTPPPEDRPETAVATAADTQLRAMADRGAVHAVPFAPGRHMVWRRFGRGKPLVLLHGGHGDWMHWFRNVDALATVREVWVPDMPGFGDSDALDDPTFARLCDATLATLHQLVDAAAPVDMAGFSFGGMVAAALAGRRPVARLALVGSGGHGAARRAHAPLLNWKKAASETESLAMLRANVRTFMFHDAHALTPLVDAVYARECRRTRFRSRGAWGEATLRDFLMAARTEILLMWGDRDVTLAAPAAYSESLRDAGVHHALSLVKGGGHWLQCEAAERVNAELLGFFEMKSAAR